MARYTLGRIAVCAGLIGSGVLSLVAAPADGRTGGLALLVLSVAALMLPHVLAPQAPRRLTWSIAVLMCATALAIGAICLLSEALGHDVASTVLVIAGVLWIVAWPLLFLALAVAVIVDDGKMGWRLGSLVFLVAATPLGQLFLTVLMFMDVTLDDAAGTDNIGGICLAAAAIPLWIGTSRNRIIESPAAASRVAADAAVVRS